MKSKKKCSNCMGFGIWAMGSPAPMGPMDAKDGMPTIACKECGANRNPAPNKGTKTTNKETMTHNKIELKHFGKTVSVELPEGTDLDEVLYTLDGLIRALGYSFDGKLKIVEDN